MADLLLMSGRNTPRKQLHVYLYGFVALRSFSTHHAHPNLNPQLSPSLSNCKLLHLQEPREPAQDSYLNFRMSCLLVFSICLFACFSISSLLSESIASKITGEINGTADRLRDWILDSNRIQTFEMRLSFSSSVSLPHSLS